MPLRFYAKHILPSCEYILQSFLLFDTIDLSRVSAFACNELLETIMDPNW